MLQHLFLFLVYASPNQSTVCVHYTDWAETWSTFYAGRLVLHHEQLVMNITDYFPSSSVSSSEQRSSSSRLPFLPPSLPLKYAAVAAHPSHGLSMVSRKFASINRRAVANTVDASGAGLNQIGLTWPLCLINPVNPFQVLNNWLMKRF